MKIVCTIPLLPEHRSFLEKKCPDGTFYYASEKNMQESDILDADIILGCVPTTYLSNCEKLKMIQLYSAGSVPYTQPGVLRPGVILANASGAYGPSIAEHMVAATLCMVKKLYLYRDNMSTGNWKDEGAVQMIEGSKTVVLGFGDIGQAYARKMNALGSHVVGIRRHTEKVPAYVEGVYPLESLPSLLKKADILACALPGTTDTEGLLDEAMLSNMKKGSFLINVGRGNLIPTDNLLWALQEGPLAAASIDVAEEEPLPADSPLWNCRNLLITPHVSGNFHTRDILDRIVRIAGDNLEAFFKGEKITSLVDFKTGYRIYNE